MAYVLLFIFAAFVAGIAILLLVHTSEPKPAVYVERHVPHREGFTRLGTTPTTPPDGNGKGPDVPADSLEGTQSRPTGRNRWPDERDDPAARDKQSRPGEPSRPRRGAFSESGCVRRDPVIGRDQYTSERQKRLTQFVAARLDPRR